jgi:hypothetical protein
LTTLFVTERRRRRAISSTGRDSSAVLSQTRAANRFMGTAQQRRLVLSPSPPNRSPGADADVQAALWLRALNQIKGRLRLKFLLKLQRWTQSA